MLKISKFSAYWRTHLSQLIANLELLQILIFIFTNNFKYVLKMTREFSFKLLLYEYKYSLACHDQLNDGLTKYSES